MFTRRRLLQGISIAVIFSMMFSGVSLPTASAQAEDGLRRQHNSQTGRVNFIGPESGRVLPAARALGLTASAYPADPALALAERFGPEFGLKNPGRDLAVRKTRHSDNGRTIVHYQQNYQGIPVMGGELVVNTNDNGDLYSISGEVSSDLSLSTQPTVDPAQAQQTALAGAAQWYEKAPEDFVASEPELWIYDESLLQPGARPAELVWRMEVTPKDSALPVRELVLVNAQRGNLRLHFNQVDTSWSFSAKIDASRTDQPTPLPTEGADTSATFSPRSSVVAFSPRVRTYTANNYASLPGTFLCDQTNPGCTNGSDLHGDAAHQYAIGTYFLYGAKHNRNSIDNAGMVIVSSVHYSIGYDNAAWIGSQMIYGDANGFPLADDVVAHELTHGVTQYESNLYYYYQSGAINESFSDLWGEYYDQTNGLGNDDTTSKWLIGEDVSGLHAFRSLSDPPVYGDPDKMSSANYDTGGDDNGGVHTNSGINNKAVFLMVQGGDFNGKTVAALGWDKTAAIYYEANVNLLSSGADYSDLYYVLQQACINLIGQNGISVSDCEQMKNALDAVEMNAPVKNFNMDAPYCDHGNPNAIVFSDDLEAGAGNWTFSNGSRLRWQLDSPYDPYAHSGTHFLYADDYPGEITDAKAQLIPVTIPNNAYLHFAHAYEFQATSNYYDGGVLEYSPDGGSMWLDAGPLIDFNGYNGTIYTGNGNPLQGRSAFVGASHGYISTRLNLATLAGKAVSFRWRMGLDSSEYGWGWWLDDVKIYRCPLDLVAPAALADLSAATGVTTGTVNLSWRAVGDDNTIGTAAGYLVRYSASAINSDIAWSAATPVTTGIPAPQVAGQPETMTVSGLTPGAKYYFAVRAQDEDLNLSGLSNSPSAMAQGFIPVSAGIYDDTDINWIYSAGAWATYNGSGPYNSTSHYAGTIGNEAQFSFNGNKFSFTYLKASNRGLIDVYVDGTKITQLNAYSSTTTWQQTWTSSVLTSGIHMVRFVHAGGGTYIDIDAIQIFAPAPTVSVGTYDDIHAAWIFSSGWTAYTGTGPVNDTNHYTSVVGSDAQVTFNGTKFTFTYLKAGNRGLIDVYVDGTKVGQINAKSSTTAWQQTWTSPSFTTGEHTVRFVHGGGGTYIDVDAIQILAPADTVAPAAITNLSAITGSTTGTVNLSWRAVGDDNTTGTAASYLVRYSVSDINSESAWNAATPVTTGIPAPQVAGQPETMTVSGLTPGAKYYFAVRAQDEEPNLGGLSNSVSAIAQSRTPVPAGTYDDTDINWIYSGTWSAYNGSGPYNSTSHYAGTIGNEAQITFNGNKFAFTYLKASNRGLIDVYVDETKVTQINAYSSTTTWQQTWTSSVLTSGVHTVRFVHAGGGTYIDIDAIQIFDTPQIVTAGTYDDNDPSWVFSSDWTVYAGTGPVNDTDHYTSVVGSGAQITFNGTGFTLAYVKASNRGLIDVYVDGTKVGQINAKSSTTAWQQTWTSPALTPGQHTVRFVHAGTSGTYIDVDAITVLP